jgi:hypothetical protein
MKGSSSSKELALGIKNHQARAEDRAVESSPPKRPPTHELRKTAGKKRNQEKGLMMGQNMYCSTKAAIGNRRAANIWKYLFIFAAFIT